MFRISSPLFCLKQRSSAKLRRDIVTGKWVIFNPSRRNRPNQFDTEDEDASAETKTSEEKMSQVNANAVEAARRQKVIASCPFCPGKKETVTPKSVLTWDENCQELNPEDSNWSLRVVPNLYPAVTPLVDLTVEDAASLNFATKSNKVGETHHHIQKYNSSSNVGDGGGGHSSTSASLVTTATTPLSCQANFEIPAFGFHEVVIETPEHFVNTDENYRFSDAHVKRLLRSWHARGKALQNDSTNTMLRHIMYFKNCGVVAGASLEHHHSQIIALPIVSQETQRLFDVHMNYFLNFSRNVFDDVASNELSKGDRIVCSNEHFIAFVPFAAFSPFMVRFFSRTSEKPHEVPCVHFENESIERVEALADLLANVLKRLDRLLEKPDFNIVLTTPPLENCDQRKNEFSAFRTEVFTRYFLTVTPRLGTGSQAGFELGSGLSSNSMMPEESAAELRAI